MDYFAGPSHNATDRPSDWNARTLGELCDFANGLWTGKKPPLVEAKVLRNTNFNNDGTLDLTDVAELQVQVGQFEKRQLFPGDIILERSGGGPTQPVGRVVYFGLPAENYSFSNFTTRLRVRDKSALDAKYLLYFLLQFYLRGETEALQKRTTGIRNLNFADYLKVVVLLPPLPEQRRIAHVLSTIQRAIQTQDAVIAAARELKRSLMHRLFTYGPYVEPLPTKETDFGEVPLSWPEVGLEHCAKVQTGVAKGRKLDGADTVELPYLRVANVQDGYLDLDEIKTLTILRTELHRFRLQDRDVLLTEGGDFDKLGRGFIWRNQLDPCIHQNHIFAVRTDRSVLLPEFFSYLVQSVYGKRYFLKVAHRTTNLASINSTKLKALPVLLASMDEQKAIVNMLEQVDFKVAVEERRGTALVALFKSMLHQLMTGQVRVLHVEGLQPDD